MKLRRIDASHLGVTFKDNQEHVVEILEDTVLPGDPLLFLQGPHEFWLDLEEECWREGAPKFVETQTKIFEFFKETA